MTEHEARIAELSNDFAAKKKAADDFWKEHPKLDGEGERVEYRRLMSAASGAALRWVEYCSANV